MKNVIFLLSMWVMTIPSLHAQPPPITLVKDINPGSENSYPNNFTLYNGKFYFTANDGTNGEELWATDGTEAGTAIVKDISPGFGNGLSSPFLTLTVYNDKLYFTANDGKNGKEPWVTDGTEAGTMMLKNIRKNGWGDPNDFTVYNGKLYFGANDGTNGLELWVTDGTEAGTVMLKDINPGSASGSPGYFISHNGKLYFTASNGTNGDELWITDGTEAGTVMLKDINPGSKSSDAKYFTAYNDKLYFSADNGTNSNELWVTDGTEAGTKMLKDINPGSRISNLRYLIVYNDKLYFRANNSANGNELWVTDGTEAGTVMLKDINPGKGEGLYYNPAFSTYNGKLYFSAYEGVNGQEPWVTDGTEAGTVMLKDINPGSGSSSPDYFTPYNGKLYFVANNGTNGKELWVTDGTEAGTQKIVPTGSSIENPLGNGAIYGAADIGLFFTAKYDEATGVELYRLGGNDTATPAVSSAPIRLYPNPTTGIFFLQTEEKSPATIYDLNGKWLKTINLDKGKNQINISDFAAGLYWLKAQNQTVQILKR